MIMILMEWAYMATLSFLMGFACLAPFRKKGGCQIHSAVTYMMAGLLVLNVYAEYFSLFAGVGFWTSLIAVFAAVIGGMLLRRDLADFFKISKTQACQKKTERSDEGLENSKSLWRKKNKAVWLLYAGLTLLFAYGSSRGYMHYDTGLYHAQAIRWIEEYGVVPGLANLHSRFGYNSASFALSAFFSETWLIGQPMHCVAGFFALLCACKCAAGLMAFWKRKKVRISDFLSIGGIFYLIAVFREMVSPASDYFAMLVLFWVIMTWVELWEQERDCPIGEKQTVPYALLSLYLVYAATVKLSTAVILLLVLYPAVLLLRQKKWLQIAGYIALGLLIAFPYLARNVLISGWLFYPFTFLDWFPVDWKISKGYADSDAKEIQAYAREIYNVYQLDQPLKQWLPNWFAAQAGFDKLLVLAGWAAIPVSAVLAVLGAVRAVRAGRAAVASHAGSAASAENGTRAFRADRAAVAFRAGSAVSEREIGAPLPARRVAHLTPLCLSLLQLCAVVGFFFWQLGAPLVRYGYFYVLFLPLTVFGSLYCMAAEKLAGSEQGHNGRKWLKNAGYWAFVGLLVAFFTYKGYNLIQMVRELAYEPYYLWQQDYVDGSAEMYEVDGVTIYVPTDRGQIGYNKFPSSPIVQDIELRGNSIRDGFRKKPK